MIIIDGIEIAIIFAPLNLTSKRYINKRGQSQDGEARTFVLEFKGVLEVKSSRFWFCETNYQNPSLA